MFCILSLLIFFCKDQHFFCDVLQSFNIYAAILKVVVFSYRRVKAFLTSLFADEYLELVVVYLPLIHTNNFVTGGRSIIVIL